MLSYQQGFNHPTVELTSDFFAQLIISDYVMGRIKGIRQHREEAHAKRVLIAANPDPKLPLNKELEQEAKEHEKQAARLKHQLPGICWQATFDESLSKSGKRGTWRKQSACRLNGLYMLDIDHLTDPREWFRAQYEDGALKLDMKAFCDDLGVLLVHVTPSGEGLRMVAIADVSRGNLSDNQHWLAKRLGIEMDEACKDATRLSFCPSYDDIIYSNYETLFNYENPEYDQIYGPQYRGGNSQPTRADGGNHQRGSHAAAGGNTVAVRPGTPAAGTPAAVVPGTDDEAARLDEVIAQGYYGVPYEKIVTAWFDVRKKGVFPAVGARHRVLLELAYDLRYICDNKAAFTLRAMCEHPMVRQYFEEDANDLRGIADSACQKQLWGTVPKRMQSVLDAAGVRTPGETTNAEVETGAGIDYDSYAQRLLPLLADSPGLREAVSQMPDNLKLGGVMVACSMLGSYLSRTWWEHFDGKFYRLSFLTYVIGAAASGKSFVTDLDELLMAPMKSSDSVGRAAEEQYERIAKSRKANEKLPDEPQAMVRYCPSQTSNNIFYRRLKNAVDPSVIDPKTGEPIHLHLVTVESELATMVRANKDSWANKHDLELKAFQNEFAGTDFKIESVKGSIQVNWNQIISGTQVSLAKRITINNVLDGSPTRLAMFIMPSNRFKMIERRRHHYDPERDSMLRQLGYKLDQVKGELKVDRLVDFCYDWEDRITKRADINDDDLADYFRKRIPIIMMRFALVRLVLRQLDDAIAGRELKVEQSDLDFAELMGDWCLDAQIYMFGGLMQEADQKAKQAFIPRKPNAEKQLIYNALPMEFKTEEALEKGLAKDAKRCNEQLKRWVENGFIEKTDGGKYRRLFKKF
jgi:hypothetical protein